MAVIANDFVAVVPVAAVAEDAEPIVAAAFCCVNVAEVLISRLVPSKAASGVLVAIVFSIYRALASIPLSFFVAPLLYRHLQFKIHPLGPAPTEVINILERHDVRCS